ncbi:class I SAM-dependent rRNA methyltransferase [Legionella jordanis]|uniref:SAM-dependent methyltransferase n=1 Tax=Legionella jordanis TaxID=456 RepID=A0A0W0VAU2_9GAMM|nr:class I SAM-dependent rRNA methyltransferase [Legionella jordanis]KTD16966.1 SAM-dependent methyltransferase [Legionella jordanis]RMX03107.1 class I SAM-dependent rRNA methyltransferase [Legionella jordanis]VEH12840.1 SAM-dependent methyltransferase [Legionella jordanis]
MRPAIYLQKMKEGAIRRGHPWIFPKAISKIKAKPTTGELVDIFSSEGELLGVGAYNHHSLYRVRVLAQSWENLDCTSIETLVQHRLHQAFQVRESLNLPNPQTNAYRLFNSEADGLSGLTIDRFNDITVVSSTAFWVEANKNIISNCLSKTIQGELLWFSQEKPLSQDGWQEFVEQKSGAKTQVMEAGIVYEIDFSNAQKTGLFLDQRQNHQRMAELSRNRRVLDLYCYTGGFALHAAKASASKVTAVDSSAQAIVQAKQNAQLNGLEHIEFIEADAREFLSKAGDYDVVILDPPKLVPSQQHLQRAKNYYRFLHRELFKSMRPGSLLMTCNCSSALSTAEFGSLVTSQAMAVGKQARVLGIYGPANCHPTLPVFPEGNYLTAVLLAVV